MKDIFTEELKDNGFIQNNHYEIVSITDKEVSLKGYITETSLNPYEIAHGGFIFGLGDTAMGVAVRNTGRKGLTLSANINFLKPGKGKYIIAHAKIIKDGKKICHVESTITDDEDHLIATMNSTYYYMD